MSEKIPPSLKGFSDGDYFDRPEYDPERVASQETGLYQHISEYADYLLIASDCPRLIAHDSPRVVYDCETRSISRVLTRYDYNSSPYGSDGRPLETKLDIRYQDTLDAPGMTKYSIEIKRHQSESLNREYGMNELYLIEKYKDSQRLIGEVTYVDAVNDTYSTRPMTPYDEKNLYNELAIMSAYVQVEEDRVKADLLNGGN